ncbi:hypothetical protein [Geodermatophilus marinus]|uniref:hypothetical protein n=1 Tax=Geodermatophilus sp. LHW52908 TaxID=2303986 RepID=UPI0013142924|nr:hypothetical protein [Geodermatophilus sp. LHW52908]
MSHPERRPDPKDPDFTPTRRGKQGRRVVLLVVLGVAAFVALVWLVLYLVAF